MAVFKCKMCGGSLEVQEGMTVCECEYCGTEQTLPTVKEEELQILFNRANVLRMKSELQRLPLRLLHMLQEDKGYLPA